MIKILVVDDEPDLEVLIKQKFRKEIRDHRYDFSFATNGVEALSYLDLNADTDILLSDINMPLMDGLTLLSKINEQNIRIKSVIVSAYGDLQNIRIAMNRGAFDFITKPINFEDLEITIEKTIKQVTQMKMTMEAIKQNNLLKMYVDETVLKYMTSQEFETTLHANEQVEATVAFIDICSFTSISENTSPDTVVKLLNTYFDVMVKEIIAQEGYVDKFIGDAIMAIFKGDYHLDRAIDACLAVRKHINELPAENIENNFRPKVSTGINFGDMISGNIGSVSLKRLDYTVIGDAVNVAQRLQSMAAPDQILISESAYQKVKESFHCKEAGSYQLKNKQHPVNVYEVLE
ncbi:MAG: response regulator [Saprospiraceae bacterium]|nr:response regulator [Saprospiraceae bacterium]